MAEYKVLITGSRDWVDRVTVDSALRSFLGKENVVVITGGCRGADLLAEDVAKSLGFTVRTYQAHWDAQGYSAGPIRNSLMLREEHSVDSPIQVCLAFHDDLNNSRGTKDCVNKATRRGIPIVNLKSAMVESAKAYVNWKLRN